jgi:serine phosphatase RsbU (regulator of sigma subunit)
VGSCYANIGTVYLDEENYDKALEYFLLDLNISIETNDKQKLGNGYVRVGSVYDRKHQYKKAMEYYDKAMVILKELDFKTGMPPCYNRMSEAALGLKDHKNAIRYADSAIALCRKLGELSGVKNGLQNLALAYADMGDYKNAYEYHVKFKQVKDSIFNNENSQQLSDLKTQYEVEKKEAELKLKAVAQEAVVLEEKKRQQLVMFAGAVILIIVIIFAVVMFNRFRLTKRQKKIIELQKELVEEKQKEVVDSITYAKHLQEAILPPIDYWHKQLPESFVLYRPKDIVAGDFYWMERMNDMVFFAAADCTGHGVPGAMVSVVCCNALNRTLLEFKITEPGKILDKTRELVIETFGRSTKEVKDGMDISLCCLNLSTNELFWSGANNPVWRFTKGKVEEIDGDKQPIGKYMEEKPFKTHYIKLEKDDVIYVFTDGYADQFGGPNGKKFKYKQLREFLTSIHKQPMLRQEEILAEHFNEWKGALSQIDDVLIIGVRV